MLPNVKKRLLVTSQETKKQSEKENKKMNKKEFDELKKMILENDGITLSSDGKIAHLKKGYMVSLEGYEKIYKDIKFIDLKVLKSYLRKAQEKKAFAV